MDPALPPTDQPPHNQNALVEVSYAEVHSPLASANQLWLHRTYLGISGLALADVIVMAQAAGMILQLVAAGAGNRPLGRLFDWIWHLQDVAYAIEWFSALYLLALARYSAEGEDPFRMPRRLLLSFGGGWVIIRFIPLGMLPTPLWRGVGVIAEIAQIVAVVTLFLYLMKIAELGNHAFLKIHLPLLLVLMILWHILSAITGNRLDSEDMRLLMMLGTAAYGFYLMLKMRAMLAKLTFTNSPPEL